MTISHSAGSLPNAFGIDTALIPEAMRNMRCWVNWVLVSRGGKTTKIPCRPDGLPASTTAPETWSSLAEVLNPSVPVDGIGIVFDGEIIDPTGRCIGGIDFDSLRKRREHETDDSGIFARKQRATRIVREAQALGAYIELSPSKGGLHILGLHASARQGRPP